MRALCLGTLLLFGCSDTRGSVDAAILPGADAGPRDAAIPPGTDGAIPPGTDGAMPPGTDGGVPPGDAGPPAPSTAFCVLGCGTQADCTTASPAYDADNYACESGSCRYTGCIDDAECHATFSSTGYGCRDSGTGIRSCLQTCTAPSDCGGGSGAFDGDNYACDASTCRYLGCNTDDECAATFGVAYGCVDAEPPPTPLPIPTARRNCVRRCTVADDCATDSGAFGADNYTCDEGACTYRGCNDDVECRTSLSSSSYVCR